MSIIPEDADASILKVLGGMLALITNVADESLQLLGIEAHLMHVCAVLEQERTIDG